MRTPENIQSKKASRSIRTDTNIREVATTSLVIKHFYHLITPMNVGRYIGLCQNKHKPLILSALAHNMYYPKSDYSWALRSCPSKLRHHMKYVEHRFSL